MRPYARKVASEPLRMAFDPKHRRFEFEFRHEAVDTPTEIFVPRYQYPDGYTVEVSDGTYEADRGNQLLIYQHSADREVHRIRVRRARKR